MREVLEEHGERRLTPAHGCPMTEIGRRRGGHAPASRRTAPSRWTRWRRRPARPTTWSSSTTTTTRAVARPGRRPADRRPPICGSRRNLGGAGGFALGMLHALALGADWVWLADDDGRPAGFRRARHAAGMRRRARPGRGVADGVRHGRPRAAGVPAAPRAGLAAAGRANCARRRRAICCPGIASLFNGALFRASTLDAVGVPDLRLFVRGDEVEMHRRLVRSGLPFGTCLDAAYLHPQGGDEFKPMLGGRMHTAVPRRRGEAVLHLPQPRLPACPSRGCASCCRRSGRGSAGTSWCRGAIRPGLVEWIRLRRLGRREKFERPRHSDVHRRRRAVEDDGPRVGRPRRRASASASCGCTWAGRTSSSATAAPCSARSGSRSRRAPRPSPWGCCTRSCSSCRSKSTCPTSRSA